MRVKELREEVDGSMSKMLRQTDRSVLDITVLSIVPPSDVHKRQQAGQERFPLSWKEVIGGKRRKCGATSKTN